MSSNSERIIATTPVMPGSGGNVGVGSTVTRNNAFGNASKNEQQIFPGSKINIKDVQMQKNGDVTVTVDPKTGIPIVNNPAIERKLNQSSSSIDPQWLTYSRASSTTNTQTKYGVPIPNGESISSSTTCTQTKYGVPIPNGGSTSSSTTCTQTKYGVPIPSVGSTQTKYGVPIPTGAGGSQTGSSVSGDINVSFSQLESNISTLKETISSLRSSWDDGVKKNLDSISDSWVGADCEAYLAKLSKMDNKVHGTVSALELLCNAYERTRDILKDNQADLVSTIDKIN